MLQPELPKPPVNPAPVPPRRRSELTSELLKAQAEPDAELARYAMERGAHWFYWAAALSFANSVLVLSGDRTPFIAGLAISRIADQYAAHHVAAGPVFSVGVSFIVALVFCGFGYFASRGSLMAIAAGMTLYAFDGLLFLGSEAYLPALFHGYVLYMLWLGWRARRELYQLRTPLPTAPPTEEERRIARRLPFA